MGKNPSSFKDNLDHPVETISWCDAQLFCQKLSQKSGKNYRLPTEAEWEYACRAGTHTRYCFGDNEKDLKNYAWFWDNSGMKTHSVGQKKPNYWGLYDMHGNVKEYCIDDWHDSYIQKIGSFKENGNIAWGQGQREFTKVARGGSWNLHPNSCRSSHRFKILSNAHSAYLGFRVVQDIFCVSSSEPPKRRVVRQRKYSSFV